MAFPEAVYTKTYHLRDRYNKSRAPGHVWKCDPAPSRRPIDRTPSKTRCGRSGPGCTWSSLACQQGCTEASHDLSIMAPFSCAAPTPPSAAAERDALGLAPVPSTSMLALGDNMVSNVEAAAQSTKEQCSWSAPMAGSTAAATPAPPPPRQPATPSLGTYALGTVPSTVWQVVDRN